VDEPDLIDWDEATADLGEDMAERLSRHTQHRDRHGRPRWEREHLSELLRMLEMGLLG
jgi:hypothetical protein